MNVDIGRPLRAIDRYQRAHGWLGFPLAVMKRYGDSGAGGLAATIAYYGFFSVFPLLMVLTSVAGMVPPVVEKRLTEKFPLR